MPEKAQYATVHRIRFHEVKTPEMLHLVGIPGGALSWKIGPSGEVGPNGYRLPADVWCAEVLDWPALMREAAFRRLDFLQTVSRADGTPVHTTSCPIRIDGKRPHAMHAAPLIGEHTAAIRGEFGLS